MSDFVADVVEILLRADDDVYARFARMNRLDWPGHLAAEKAFYPRAA